MSISIVISSGKGGTGKTFVSTNIARVLEKSGEQVTYIDCDVEEPNGHLFLKPEIYNAEEVFLSSPGGVDYDTCILCGRCAEACSYNAIAVVKEKVLFFKNLCHVCGACSIVCPEEAIQYEDRKIGDLYHGKSGTIDFHYAELQTGEGGMSPRLIKKVKNFGDGSVVLLDSPPGTSCPVVETVKDADLCVLITDPTPFGINDLRLAVDMCRELDKEPVVLVNRAEYLSDELKIYCTEQELEIIGEIPDERRVAECYSVGNLAVEEISDYYAIFSDISLKLIKRAREKRRAVKKPDKISFEQLNSESMECSASANQTNEINGTEITVISGKGGTGKTSLVAAFCALEKNIAIADCDVDAADLHLVLNPELKKTGGFSGGSLASINSSLCTACGDCYNHCSFDAVKKSFIDDIEFFEIDDVSCEGCGVCGIVCKHGAVEMKTSVNGEWYESETRFGPMSHAKLGVAEENSGKLVSLVRMKKNDLSRQYQITTGIIDGSPGTGCPVIASITGTDYAVIVTEPTVSGVHDLKRVLEVAEFFHVKSGVIVNKHDLNLEKTEEIKEIAQSFDSHFLGAIPYDRSVTEAQMKKISVVEYTDNETTEVIKNIWSQVKTSSEKVLSH